MFRNKILELDALIEQCPDVNFRRGRTASAKEFFKDWGLSKEITKAEQKLGFNLPDSYKWWVKKYRGGELGFDQAIYTVSDRKSKIITFDIVASHLHPHPALPKNALVFFKVFEGDEIYFFDVLPKNNEYAVYQYRVSDRCVEIYANDFIGFLIKFMKLNF